MVMSKAGSEVILKCLMGQEKEIDVDNLPWGPEDEKVPAGIETVIPATMVRPARGARVEEVMIKREKGVPHSVVVGVVEGNDEDPVVIKSEPPD